MTKLIASAVILVALAILVILNVGYKSTINLFGAQLSNISVVVIALAGFVIGIVYSAVLYVTSRISRRRKANLKQTGKSPTAKAVEVEKREKSIEADEEADAVESAAPDLDPELTIAASRMESEGGISKAQRPRVRR